MNEAQKALRDDNMSPESQLEQVAIMDEVHDQQIRVEMRGKCQFGCSRDCLVRAWAFSIRQRDFKPGMMTVCRYTRMPCPEQVFSPLLEQYSVINGSTRPLLSLLMNSFGMRAQ